LYGTEVLINLNVRLKEETKPKDIKDQRRKIIEKRTKRLKSILKNRYAILQEKAYKLLCITIA